MLCPDPASHRGRRVLILFSKYLIERASAAVAVRPPLSVVSFPLVRKARAHSSILELFSQQEHNHEFVCLNAAPHAGPAEGVPADYSVSGENVRIRAAAVGARSTSSGARTARMRTPPHGSSQHPILSAWVPSRRARKRGRARSANWRQVPALVPAHTSVGRSWPGRISFSVLMLDPAFLDR
jgi:hypothetical protein